MRIVCLIFVALLNFLADFAFAKPLVIEISGGVETGIKIAMPDFNVNYSSFRKDSFINPADIIKKDLRNSGQFHPIAFHSGVSFMELRKHGVENLVTGEINVTFSNIEVSFMLADVYREKVLANFKFNIKNADELRALSHHISDLIFEKITGIKGFFSTRIAYITMDRKHGNNIYTLNVADYDGFNDKALLVTDYPIMSPAWSNDGKRIAFVALANRAAVNVVDVNTGKIAHVSNSPGINGAPTWSPDNKSLILVLSKDGAPKLYQLDLDSKQLKRLTQGDAIDTEPKFFPDGRALAFTSNRGGNPQIYRLSLISGEIERLTFTGNYNVSPAITPDGKRLVMMHRDSAGSFNIALQDLNTGKFKILTNTDFNESPSIAPNGTMVIFNSQEGDSTVLSAVSLDGKFKLRLPVADGSVKEPVWSPFL